MVATPGLDAPGNRRIPLQRVTLARDQRSNPRTGRRRLGARRPRDGRLRIRQRGSRDADVLLAAAARGGGELPARGRELRPDRSGGPRQTGKPVRGGSPHGLPSSLPTSLLVVAVALAVVLAVVRGARLRWPGLRSAVAIVPVPRLRPVVTPLVAPVRGRLALPLLPVSRRHVVVTHWHRQDGPRNELRSDEDPRAVVAPAHMPARGGEHPILPTVEEKITRRVRRVTHRRDSRDDHEGRRRRQAEADIHVNLSVSRSRQDQPQQGDDGVVDEHVDPPPTLWICPFTRGCKKTAGAPVLTAGRQGAMSSAVQAPAAPFHPSEVSR